MCFICTVAQAIPDDEDTLILTRNTQASIVVTDLMRAFQQIPPIGIPPLGIPHTPLSYTPLPHTAFEFVQLSGGHSPNLPKVILSDTVTRHNYQTVILSTRELNRGTGDNIADINIGDDYLDEEAFTPRIGVLPEHFLCAANINVGAIAREKRAALEMVCRRWLLWNILFLFSFYFILCFRRENPRWRLWWRACFPLPCLPPRLQVHIHYGWSNILALVVYVKLDHSY